MGRFVRQLLASALCTVVAVATVVAAVQQVPYKNDTKGYALLVPDNWEIKESDAGSVVTFTAPVKTGYRPNEQVRMEVLAQEKNVGEYAQTVHPKLRAELTDLKILKSGRQTISHTGARWWIITFRQNEAQLKGILFIVVKDKKAFTIIGAAPIEQFPQYRDALGNIGGSLTIF